MKNAPHDNGSNETARLSRTILPLEFVVPDQAAQVRRPGSCYCSPGLLLPRRRGSGPRGNFGLRLHIEEQRTEPRRLGLCRGRRASKTVTPSC
jgi:hypothetical protein